MATPIQIFIAYSREDAPYLNEIKKALRPLELKGSAEIWYDGEIQAGTVWEDEIKQALHHADIIMLLLSSDSIYSEYFYKKEVQEALARHEQGLCHVVPVILRDCLWEETQLAKLQALPQDAKPIADWKSPDAAYKSIAVGVAKLVEEIKADRDQAHHDKNEQERLKYEREEAEQLRQENQKRLENERYKREQQTEQDRLNRESEDAKNKKQFWQQLQAADELYAQQKYAQAQTAYQDLLNWDNKTDLGYTGAQPHLAQRLISCKTETQHATLKKQAFDLHQQGKYKNALAIVQQALQHRTDPDLGNLQTELNRLINKDQQQRNALLQKVGMGAAGVLLLLLMVWGVRTLVGEKIVSPDTVQTQNPIVTDTTELTPPAPAATTTGGGSKPSIKMISIPGKDFKMSETEVTIGQYLAFCKATNSHYPEWLEQGSKFNIRTGTDDHYKKAGMSESNTNYPITGVSATDADAFCRWMGGSLPTEQEWEYAAKGGQSYEYAGSNTIGEVAWYSENSGSKAHPVKQKRANGYGLYDMTGNVWEWTSSTEGSDRVLRGGSWCINTAICRVAFRYYTTPSDRNSFCGFRLAVR